jgi:hypothetical protein
MREIETAVHEKSPGRGLEEAISDVTGIVRDKVVIMKL